jgi:UDP-glucose 4-epimerase
MLATGAGHSVMEVVRTVEEVTGQKVPYVFTPRREGDPPKLVASSEKLRATLGWKPQYPDLRTIVAHGWNFARRQQ